MLQWISKLFNKLRITAARGGLCLAAVFCLFFIIFCPGQAALAQTIPANTEIQQGLQTIQQPLGLPATDIRLIIANIIRAALGLMGIVLLVLIIYGGYLWMTAGGNDEQIAKAKQVLLNATVGLIIILSAYGIVIFVMRILGIGQGQTQEVGVTGLAGPVITGFQGSGALGTIIKDHYPSRDQKDVPRGTKIIITFRRPVLASSFIHDTAGKDGGGADGVFGNCRTPTDANPLNWETDCDQIILDDDHINITRFDNNTKIRGAAVVVALENGQVKTIVIRPWDGLGSDEAPVAYKVHLGPKILLDDPVNGNASAFEVKIMGNDYYEWYFTCSTVFDTTPPHVLSVFPDDGAVEPRNSVIQVDFSEPMDPTGIQGSFAKDDEGNYLPGKNLYLKTDHNSTPAGNFTLTNNYRTLEFTPSTQCDTNACGNPIYCLPACSESDACASGDIYQILVRAGLVTSANSFEARPFSGVMDLSGNALDGNFDGKPETASSDSPLFLKALVPDNYHWQFTITKRIDKEPPYIVKVTPGINEGNIKANDPWVMVFSKRMRVDPMYNIYAEEKPTPADRKDNTPLCRKPQIYFDTKSGFTTTVMDHCPFLDGSLQYYYPIITSTVEDVHFNCFYPGLGPGGYDYNFDSSYICNKDQIEAGSPCCAVDPTSPYCCNGNRDPNNSTNACLNNVKNNSPIPTK